MRDNKCNRNVKGTHQDYIGLTFTINPRFQTQAKSVGGLFCTKCQSEESFEIHRFKYNSTVIIPYNSPDQLNCDSSETVRLLMFLVEDYCNY